MLFNVLDPELFVLGGGVIKARRFFHEEMMKQLRKRTNIEIPEDRVQYSRMNDNVVLYGAYYLIREYLEKNKHFGSK